MRRSVAFATILLLLGGIAFAQRPAATPPAGQSQMSLAQLAPNSDKITFAPVSKRNADLESRLKAVILNSAGVWGVSVRHVEKGEAAGVNDKQPFEMASVFKVGVLATLYRQAEQGKVDLNQRVTFEHPERFFGSGILATLKPGLQPTIYDLAVLMITISDNAATDTLCDIVGVPNVNARVQGWALPAIT